MNPLRSRLNTAASADQPDTSRISAGARASQRNAGEFTARSSAVRIAACSRRTCACSRKAAGVGRPRGSARSRNMSETLEGNLPGWGSINFACFSKLRASLSKASIWDRFPDSRPEARARSLKRLSWTSTSSEAKTPCTPSATQAGARVTSITCKAEEIRLASGGAKTTDRPTAADNADRQIRAAASRGSPWVADKSSVAASSMEFPQEFPERSHLFSRASRHPVAMGGVDGSPPSVFPETWPQASAGASPGVVWWKRGFTVSEVEPQFLQNLPGRPDQGPAQHFRHTIQGSIFKRPVGGRRAVD